MFRGIFILFMYYFVFYIIYSIEIYHGIQQSDNIFLDATFRGTLILPRILILKIFIQNGNHLKTRALLYYLLVTDVPSSR